MTADHSADSWRPVRLFERLGAAVAAPRAALVAAGDGSAAGRAGSDATLLLLLSLVVIQLREVVSAGYLILYDSPSGGLAALAGLLGKAVWSDLVLILVAGVAITVAAGRQRAPGRDFDLGCVAYVPFVVVKLLAGAAGTIAGAPLMGLASRLTMGIGYGWAAIVVVLAIGQARSRGASGRRGARARTRWAARGVVALCGGLLAVNATWVVRHWEQVRPTTPGDVAPLFELPRVDGQGTVALQDLRGQVVIVDFWATWCGPCRDSMPSVERVYRAYRSRGLEVVSINTEGWAARHKVARLVQQLGVSSPVVSDEGQVFAAYRGSVIPYLLVVDQDGVIREVHRGMSGGAEAYERELGAVIEELMDER